eukprot:Amastigsp_a181480_39.p3 type:complete len:101 gc:universal Amastigsp_a181480_39:1075-1377(+)
MVCCARVLWQHRCAPSHELGAWNRGPAELLNTHWCPIRRLARSPDLQPSSEVVLLVVDDDACVPNAFDLLAEEHGREHACHSVRKIVHVQGHGERLTGRH